MNNPSTNLTVTQAARYLGAHRRTVDRLLARVCLAEISEPEDDASNVYSG